MKVTPNSKPNITDSMVDEILKHYEVDRAKYPVVLIGIRGYYQDSMGKPNMNDRRMYDDAAVWVTPKGHMTFNFNTDPNGYRAGEGVGSKKGMASLKDGVWRYKMGTHYGSIPHKAFRQAAPVMVMRDGKSGHYSDFGWFGINIHRGGKNSTSSLGCQTVPSDQWDSFKALGYAELKGHNQSEFPYILIDEKERRNLKKAA